MIHGKSIHCCKECYSLCICSDALRNRPDIGSVCERDRGEEDKDGDEEEREAEVTATVRLRLRKGL